MAVMPDGVVDTDPFAVFGPVLEVSDPDAAAALAVALGTPVGPERIAALCRVDAGLLNQHDRVDHMAAWAGCGSWVTARGELALARVAGPEPEPDPGAHNPTSKPTGNIAQDTVCATIGAALGMTPFAVMNRIGDARAAAAELAPVTTRMLDGQWTRAHLWHAGRAVAGHRPHPGRTGRHGGLLG